MASPTFIRNRMRPLHRMPVNPFDKSTIVSIFPKKIEERKATIQPGIFTIEAGSLDNPALLVVGTSSWWKEQEENQDPLEIPVMSHLVADSVVRDYCNGLIACDMENNMPGLFWIPGEVTKEELKKKHNTLVINAYNKQRNWFMALVKIADTLWARSNGNPLAIDNNARLAARELNLNTKEWLKDYQTVELVRCDGCGSLKNPDYPVCPTCKTIDQKHPKAKELKFAV